MARILSQREMTNERGSDRRSTVTDRHYKKCEQNRILILSDGLNSFMSGLTKREQGEKRNLSADARRCPNSEKSSMSAAAWDDTPARFPDGVTQ